MDSPEIAANILSKKEDIRFIGYEIAERILGQAAIARALDTEEVEEHAFVTMPDEEFGKYQDRLGLNSDMKLPGHHKVIEVMMYAPIIAAYDVARVNEFKLAEVHAHDLLLDNTDGDAEKKSSNAREYDTLLVTSSLSSVILKQTHKCYRSDAERGTNSILLAPLVPTVSAEEVDEYLGRYLAELRNIRQFTVPELKEKLNPYLFLSQSEEKD